MSLHEMLKKLNEIYKGESISLKIREDGDNYIFIMEDGKWTLKASFDTLPELESFLRGDK